MHAVGFKIIKIVITSMWAQDESKHKVPFEA
jgi:hypothetical protein